MNSEYSATSTVSALSRMGYHGMTRQSTVPFELKTPTPSANLTENNMGNYKLPASVTNVMEREDSHNRNESGSEAESIASDQRRTYKWDGRKKRKHKTGKSHKVDFRFNRDESVEQGMNLVKARGGQKDGSVKEMRKLSTQLKDGVNPGIDRSKSFRPRSKSRKKKRRSFLNKNGDGSGSVDVSTDQSKSGNGD